MTAEEAGWIMMSGCGDPVIQPLSVTENGTYTVPEGVDGYSPVYVNVKSGSLSLDEIKNLRNLATVTIGDYKWECKSPVVSAAGIAEIRNNVYKQKLMYYPPVYYFLLNEKYAMSITSFATTSYPNYFFWYTQNEIEHMTVRSYVNYWVTGASFKGSTSTTQIKPQFSFALYSSQVDTNDGVVGNLVEIYQGDVRFNPSIILTNMSAQEQVEFEAGYLQEISTATPIIEIMPKVE